MRVRLANGGKQASVIGDESSILTSKPGLVASFPPKIAKNQQVLTFQKHFSGGEKQSH